jgi:hypothetical protein
MLAPYVHSKRGTLPSSRFLPDQIEVPQFTSITQAEDYLASIPVLLGNGAIDSQSALELSTLTKNWLDAIYAHQEYDLKLQAQGGGSDAVIRIEGGLPRMPGHDGLIMPGDAPVHLNGHNGHGPVIDHPEPPALTESTPSEGQEP